jgi:hypothetical protein
LLLIILALLPSSQALATPVSLDFTGSIFGVIDPSNVFATMPGDTYTIHLTYDADLLVGVPAGAFTNYDAAAGETSITFSFESSSGDSFTSDNSFPIRIGVKNTPDFLVTMHAGDGRDSFTLHGNLDAVTTLNLVLLEGPGSNPLSSNDLPLGAFGSGPGTWNVSELDIDRTDMFANISGSVANITDAGVTVPESSALPMYAFAVMALWTASGRRRAVA